jgi:Pyruvate/2-oxoacid:ferredoxin oxidoreductase delta subunit
MFIPDIQEGKCTNCKACCNICPKLVFESKDDVVEVTNALYCTGCESCCAVCPKDAIKIDEV